MIAEEGSADELNEFGFGGDNDPDTWEGVVKMKEKEKEKEKEKIERYLHTLCTSRVFFAAFDL